MTRLSRRGWLRILLGLVVVAVAVLGKVLPPYYAGLLTQVLIFSIFAMSLDILLGFTGLPSLGHAAMFGAGAYGAALIGIKVTSNVWVELAVGLVGALIVAMVFGALVLRSTGAFFLMITLALAQLLYALAFGWRGLTGGDDGLPGVHKPHFALVPGSWSSTANFFFLTLLVFAISAVALFILVRSPFGRTLQGVRESETRMRALGYNVWLHKYLAFVISGIFAGVAGILFVLYHGFVSPEVLGIQQSGNALLMVILGGPGTLWGGVIGALAVVLLTNLVSSHTIHWQLALGVMYILVAFGARRWTVDRVRSFLS